MPERPVRAALRRPAGDVVAAGPGETVAAAARRMAAQGCGSVLVTEGGRPDGRLLGIFTERDLLVRVVAPGLDPGRTLLRDAMTADPETIGAGEPLSAAIRRMDEGAFRHLPVLAEDGRVLGVLSSRDIPVLELGRMAPELDERHRLAERLW